MADPSSLIAFEDVPLDDARRMGRAPQMDQELSHALKEKIQSLSDTAIRLSLPEATSPTTMKHRILRVAAELKVAVTVRKVAGGLLFWHSTQEDLTQAEEVAQS